MDDVPNDIANLLRDPRYGWIPIGREAFGLVESDRMVATVFKSGPDPGLDESGEPVVAEAGYFFLDCQRPQNQVWIVGPDVSWDEARIRAAIEFHTRRRSRDDT